MARAHTRNGYTNPEVRFERSDINVGSVGWVVFWMSAALVVIFCFCIWFALWLFRRETTVKESDLPLAYGERHRLPPNPRLEGLEDLRENNPRLMPPRAAEYYRPQEQRLARGDKQMLPIDQAIEALAGKLPARAGEKAPTGFSVRLPSKAAAGRVETGGE